MKNYSKYTARIVALLVLGSATLLLSCKAPPVAQTNPETLITQRSDTITTIVSENGRMQYRFSAPLMERYELAREPYMEYRAGIYLETFRDSTQEIESTILADYAIRYENRAVWQARGNVVATGEDGRTLYTDQLFWDEKTERIYSNVESTVVQGDDVFIGEGFESDDKFKNWTFRNYTGRLAVDVSPNDGSEPEGGEKKDTPAENVSAPAPQGNTPGPVQSATQEETLLQNVRPAPAPSPASRPDRDMRRRDDVNLLKEAIRLPEVNELPEGNGAAERAVPAELPMETAIRKQETN